MTPFDRAVLVAAILAATVTAMVAIAHWFDHRIRRDLRRRTCRHCALLVHPCGEFYDEWAHTGTGRELCELPPLRAEPIEVAW